MSTFSLWIVLANRGSFVWFFALVRNCKFGKMVLLTTALRTWINNRDLKGPESKYVVPAFDRG